MIRRATPIDTERCVELAGATGVFKPHEIVALREVLDDYHAVNQDEGHEAYLLETDKIQGFVYLAPVAMTDQTWELWWIAVDPRSQGQGLGRELMAFVEHRLKEAEARLLLIETSSTPAYVATRAFYERLGYALKAQVPDFYCDGDDKLIFWKRLTST